ncbi:MAG: bile acid:sodium symporter family protein [Saprospiraceae bacterium]|nr:bile acid:sodium symporter family protein [Saprospiraceae bacterium]
MCETIDSVVINFNQDNVLILNLCVAFIMFGVALDIELKDFKRIFAQPKIPLVGLASEYIVLPAITLGLIALFRPAPSFALGMILLTACPGGSVSNYMVHLAKGNAALSVTLTSITTLLAVVITPVGFVLLAQIFPYTSHFLRSIGIETSEVNQSIFILIIFPLATGMICRARFPQFTQKIKKIVSGLSMIIFLSFVLLAIMSNWDNIKSYVHCVFGLIAIHNGLALLGGFAFARFMRLSLPDARTVSIETGIQNTALGLVIAFQFFDGLGGITMILAWWGIWHLITGFFLAVLWRRKFVLNA